MSPVDPTGQDLKRYLAEDPGGEVVMLNLLTFKAEGGRERYAQYAAAVEPFLARVGASIVSAGDAGTPLVAPAAHDWDAVLLVRYPSRQAFAQMVADPDYQQITHLRTEALDAAVLQPLSVWAGA